MTRRIAIIADDPTVEVAVAEAIGNGGFDLYNPTNFSDSMKMHYHLVVEVKENAGGFNVKTLKHSLGGLSDVYSNNLKRTLENLMATVPNPILSEEQLQSLRDLIDRCK